MKTNNMRVLGVGAFVLSFGVSLAQATVITDSFESYANQAAMEVNWASLGTSGQFKTDGTYNHTPGGQNYLDANPTGDIFGNRYNFTGATGEYGRYEVWFYDKGGASDPFEVTLMEGTNEGAGLGVGYLPWQGENYIGFDPNGFAIQALPARSVGWHQVRWELLAPGVQLYFDGVLKVDTTVGAHAAWFDLPNGANSIKFGSRWGDTGAGNAFAFDDFSHVFIPEPSVVFLMSFGALMLWGRREAFRGQGEGHA